MNTARLKARDARRLSDINSLQKALALYNNDNNTYPVSVSTTTLNGGDAVSSALVSGGMIPAAIKDPQSPSYDYTYSSNAIGNTYTLSYCLETNSVPNNHSGCGNSVTP